MIDYVIIVKKAGEVIRREIVSATSSLVTIDFVESTYTKKDVNLSDKAGETKLYKWSGLEFEARPLKMELS